MELLTYRSPDGEDLLGEFYRTEGKRDPVVIAVHGGAWRAGSPARYRALGEFLANHGISVLAVSYRYAGAAGPRFPAQMQDLAAAVAFLVENAVDFGIDVDRLGMMGDSAGAHLAALYALGAFRAPALPRAKAMVGIYGVYDLLAQFEHDLLYRPTDQITELLLGKSALDDRRAYFDASPLSYVRRGNGKPAFFISWGTADDVTDCETQSVAFLNALKRAGYTTRALPIVGAPHFWIDEPLGQPHSYAAVVAPRVLSFLTNHL